MVYYFIDLMSFILVLGYEIDRLIKRGSEHGNATFKSRIWRYLN